MSGLVELQLAPAVAGALEAFGYSAEDPAVRDQVPAALRGTNLALATPPAARYAVPALAGLVSAAAGSRARALVLAPEHALEEWADALFPLADAAGVPAVMATTPARATRRLREGGAGVLLTTPANALALHQRSALKPEGLGTVVLVWPELFDSDDALTAVMQDLPLEAQRILVPVAPLPAHPLVERYARRALLTGPLAGGEPTVSPARARVATVAWSRRGAALAAVLESEDPASLVVWCLDRRSADAARAALPVADASITVATRAVPKAGLVVAWDLPSPADLAGLAASGEVVLLVPPHAAGYLKRICPHQSLLRLRGALEQARDQASRRRDTIQAEIDHSDLDHDLLALAPLFERLDPARVAAALYRLWCRRPVEAEPAPVAAGPAAGDSARLWIGVGKKDGASPADLVAALARDVGVPAASIGRIEIRELYSLVEVPAGQAEEIARGLSGKLIRRRRVVAKVDRGRATDGSRGPSGSSRRERPARPKP